MLADARRIRQTARITRGPTGERILATQIIELPAESTKEQRQACAQAFVDDWRERGHQAIAVVHMHGHDKDRPQPHLHVLATGRPVGADGTVDRSAPLWRNRDEVKAERARTARLVNEHCHTVAAFHPGGFKDIGREEDTPKWRTPTGVYLKVVAAEAEGAGWEEKEEAGGRNTPPPASPLSSPSPSGRGKRRSRRRAGAAKSRPGSGRRSASGSPWPRPGAASSRRISTGSRRIAPGRPPKSSRPRHAPIRPRAACANLRSSTRCRRNTSPTWHGDRGAELPDLATVEGQREAWASMRAWEIEERKRRKAEAAAKKDEHEKALADERDSTQEKIAEAVQRALETEPDPAPPASASPQPDLPAT